MGALEAHARVAAGCGPNNGVEALITAEITSILPELATRRRGISDESIVQLGVDSLDIRVLVQNVNSKLGVDLPLSIVFEHPTPAELAAHAKVLVQAAHENRGKMAAMGSSYRLVPAGD